MYVGVLAAMAALWGASAIAAETTTQFWNLTSATVVDFQLSHAGSGEYGENLATAKVDRDGRISISDIPTGRYDAELKFTSGRICFARDIKIVAGKAFSVDDKALTACSKK